MSSSSGSGSVAVEDATTIEAWKIVATIVIFFSGCIGAAAPPLASALQRAWSASGSATGFRPAFLRVVERMLMAVGCGVMLSTALIHIFMEADAQVTEAFFSDVESPYPLAAAVCTGAAIIVFVFHVELHHRMDHEKQPIARMHTLEAGLVVHSVLIGFAIGSNYALAGLRALTVAMIFHQLCEGFAMGSSIKEAAEGDKGISSLHQGVMIILFGLSTPVGVLIGWLAVANETAAGSKSSIGAQGILDAVAAGILLTAALCDFMPELYGLTAHHHGTTESIVVNGESMEVAVAMSETDVSPRSVHPETVSAVPVGDAECLSPSAMRIVNHLGILVGATAMAVLAMWS